MKIVRSTDSRHLGTDLGSINTGDTVDLKGFLFTVMRIARLENGNLVLSNPNYQLECEE